MRGPPGGPALHHVEPPLGEAGAGAGAGPGGGGGAGPGGGGGGVHGVVSTGARAQTAAVAAQRGLEPGPDMG